MLISSFDSIKISGVSAAIPTTLIPVTSFNEEFGEEAVADFSKMTGVQSICRAIPQQTAADLGFEAAIDVIQKSGIDTNEIGLIIFVSQKPDYRSPSTAFVIHHRLNLSKDCTCFDINLACSGFTFGLQTASAMLKTSDKKYALLVTADTSHRTLSPKDRTMIMLFGDSGSALILEKIKDTPKLSFAFRTDGSRFKSIITPAGAYRNRFLPKERVPWSDGIERSDYDTHMKGMDVFGFSITDVPKLLKDFMNELNVTPDAFDYLGIHQANMYIIKQIARKLKITEEKIPIALDRFGNNSSNSVPLMMCDSFGDDNTQKNLRLLITGFGAGLSWGCGDITINTDVIYPLIKTDEFYKEAVRV